MGGGISGQEKRVLRCDGCLFDRIDRRDARKDYGEEISVKKQSQFVENFWTTYFEAECCAALTGACRVSTEYFPYLGDGYVEMNNAGGKVCWDSIRVPRGGSYWLIIKYANHRGDDLPCELKVNGVKVKTIPFSPFLTNWAQPWPEAHGYNPQTVGWAKYWNARVLVELEEGKNVIELTSVSEKGGPHIDNLAVSSAVGMPSSQPVIDVRDYGAVGDGATDDTEAIASAIKACPPGGTVVLEGGVFMAGSLTLKSNMTLWIGEGAILRAILDKICCYPEAAFEDGYITRYFLFAADVENLVITGGGVIDLNTTKKLPGNAHPLRPTLLGWVNCRNIVVSNVDLINGDFWMFVPQRSNRIVIDGINLFNRNKDGIAPLDCHDVQITNCVISAGDDALTPKSYTKDGVANLIVKNVTINYTKWKGIKFGFSSVGDFRDCLFEDIAMVHVQAGITVLLLDGGNASNLRFNRIRMNNVYTPITLLNGGGLRSGVTGLSVMRNIRICDLEARNVYSPSGSFIMGTRTPELVHRVEDVRLEHVNVQPFRGGLKEVPPPPLEYDGRKADIRIFGNLPAWAYYMRHADHIVFEDVKHRVDPPDVRPDIVLDDVNGFVRT